VFYIVGGGSGDDDPANSTMPLAALLTACAAQRAKSALQREATRALALLLALQMHAGRRT
jgi:hypothetical protein